MKTTGPKVTKLENKFYILKRISKSPHWKKSSLYDCFSGQWIWFFEEPSMYASSN